MSKWNDKMGDFFRLVSAAGLIAATICTFRGNWLAAITFLLWAILAHAWHFGVFIEYFLLGHFGYSRVTADGPQRD